MKNTNRWIALSLLLGILLGSLSPAMMTSAEASTKGRRNTAIGLGILTGVALVKGKTGLAVAGALGTAYAYHRYRKGKKADRRSVQARRIQWYKNRYGRNWRAHYTRRS